MLFCSTQTIAPVGTHFLVAPLVAQLAPSLQSTRTFPSVESCFHVTLSVTFSVTFFILAAHSLFGQHTHSLQDIIYYQMFTTFISYA
jgi:cell shape-determining protein MreD